MLLNWIVRNKYKLMAFIIGLYVLLDMVQHKGLIRVMMAKDFPNHIIDTTFPANKNTLINQGKEWVKAINTKELMNGVDKNCTGMECDVYFDKSKNYFDVHHDNFTSTGLDLDDLLQVYSARGLKASIWLDLKNLRDTNNIQAVTELVRLRNKYGLANKILVESKRPQLLKPFCDSGFATSYYTPFFNPYLASDDSLKHWADSLTAVINSSSVSALSGYYFQYPFLQHYFPNYPVLIWSPNDKFSIINWWYKKRIMANKGIFISLYP